VYVAATRAKAGFLFPLVRGWRQLEGAGLASLLSVVPAAIFCNGLEATYGAVTLCANCGLMRCNTTRRL
jgi:hypothetical protein